MIVYKKLAVLKKTGSQNLASAAMSVVTSFGKDWQLDGVYIHFSGATTETVTITRDSDTGANYDTVIKSEDVAAVTDFVFRPTGMEILKDDDEIKVAITNANTSNIAYLEIVGHEI